MEDRNRLSRWLYNVLERVGASERLKRLQRQTAVTAEIQETVRERFTYGTLFNAYFCGSSYEGSTTPALASDKDIIYCFGSLHVVLDAAVSPIGESLLMVRDSWTYPGYVKLQRVKDRRPQYGHHMLPPDDCDVDTIGRICLKHIIPENVHGTAQMRVQGPAQMHLNERGFHITECMMHGPALMHIDEYGVHVTDSVTALRCDEIPQSAQEWIMRLRPYGWPSPDQSQTMSRMGCMVVGVGHMSSGEKEIEWRMSYTLQERMLMSSLNSIQHKVYILLKMVNKNMLRNFCPGETLTSYHFKTCVLYAVQMSPPRVWTQDNLIDCLVWCLKLMVKWLETNFCPSFLSKDQNLLMKEGFSRLRMCLLKEMRNMIESGHQFLYMLQSDNVGDILRNGDWRMHREVTIERKNEYVANLKRWYIKHLAIYAIGLLHIGSTMSDRMGDRNYDPFILSLFLDHLKSTRHINKYTLDVTQSAVNYLFPWLHLHIANGFASIGFMCPDRAVRERAMKIVDLHLNDARGIDLVNERLTVATVLYAFDKYEECSHLLHLIESDFFYQVYQVCPCIGTWVVSCRDIQNKHEVDKQTARMSMRKYIKSMTAFCVIFLPSATAIVPEPLQYEMQRSLGTPPGSRYDGEFFWFDWAAVDARVYLYFMQYLVNSKLHRDVHRNVARDNLRKEIYEDNCCEIGGHKSALGHKDTAFNLMGWIYMQEELLAEAYMCFHVSWTIRPVHNAAKYHMRDMIRKIRERWQQH